MKEPLFQGTATAMITPFCDHEIDFEAYDRLLQRQLNAKVPALIVTGTTGEASTMNEIEKVDLWHHSVQAAEGSCKIIAGIGTNDTYASCRLAELAERVSVDGLLAVTPYYNKCTQEGLIEHYRRIADATSLPLILYNVPSRTGVNLLPETCAKLSEHPNINGVKEASGNLHQLSALLSMGLDLSVWCGNDDQTVAAMALGAKGVVSVLSNLLPEKTVEMTAAALSGDFKHASELQLSLLPLIDTLFEVVNPIPIKAALSELGYCKNELRLPLTRQERFDLSRFSAFLRR